MVIWSCNDAPIWLSLYKFEEYNVYHVSIFALNISDLLPQFMLIDCLHGINIMTPSNGSMFRVTGHLCGEFTGHRWIPRTKASDAELWYFFDLRLNKRLSKQSWVWWFETPVRPLWRHCNETNRKRCRKLNLSKTLCATCIISVMIYTAFKRLLGA